MKRRIDHPGYAVVEALTLSLEAREAHECAADYNSAVLDFYAGFVFNFVNQRSLYLIGSRFSALR
jgi:hypothetical protein